MVDDGHPPPCNRCKQNPATQNLRSERVCTSCLVQYVANKTIKRLESLQRDTRGAKLPTQPQKYLVALSRGVSSTALVHVLHENLRKQRERGQRPRYEVLAVHVDTDLESRCRRSDDGGGATANSTTMTLLDKYRSAFPEISFKQVNLEDVLDISSSIDWPARLPALDPATPPASRLLDQLHRLPSTTSRTDVQRLLTRHLLVAEAARAHCDVLLLGTNTTALAELTLAETAKGRGFSLPWQINDGTFTLPRGLEDEGAGTEMAGAAVANMPIYHPLREIFRKELQAYAGATSPPLTDLIVAADASKTAAVVSHKDVSIEDVMARYFAEVEENYPSVVANVVRTTGKLNRAGDGDGSGAQSCGLCGIPLDDAGDERWRGELGETTRSTTSTTGETAPDRGRLCYGCDRSIYG